MSYVHIHIYDWRMSQKLCSFQLINFPLIMEMTNVEKEEDKGMASHFVRHFAIAR